MLVTIYKLNVTLLELRTNIMFAIMSGEMDVKILGEDQLEILLKTCLLCHQVLFKLQDSV